MSTSLQPICKHPHVRSEWDGNEVVRVVGRFGLLSGKEIHGRPGRQRNALYNAAKKGADADCAKTCVSIMRPQSALDRVITDAEEFLSQDKEIICVVPSPQFTNPQVSNNRLPWAYAAYLAHQLGGRVGYEITQSARVGRTGLKGFQRLLWQPSFVGTVNPDAAYVISDDVMHWGCTLAAMRSFIVGQGGTVCAVTTLAHGSGGDQPLALSPQTCQLLDTVYGPDFGAFWKEEIGHDAISLTEAEGRFLAKWAADCGSRDSLLQRLRDRLLEAAGQGQ